MEDEHNRQNKRIAAMEENFKEIQSLALSVERMAMSMESMAVEQKRQGTKLEALEAIPRNNWNKFKEGIIGAIAGAIGVALLAALVSFL